MTASVATFKERFPDFQATGDAQCAARLAEVELTVASDWGDLRDQVVYLTLASALSGTAGGRRAQKVEDGSGANVYEARLLKLIHARALTRRVM